MIVFNIKLYDILTYLAFGGPSCVGTWTETADILPANKIGCDYLSNHVFTDRIKKKCF